MIADFTLHKNPSLAVACTACGKGVGVQCVRPSGHQVFGHNVHRARAMEADRVFLEQHGPFARIYRRQDGTLYVAIKEPVEA